MSGIHNYVYYHAGRHPHGWDSLSQIRVKALKALGWGEEPIVVENVKAYLKTEWDGVCLELDLTDIDSKKFVYIDEFYDNPSKFSDVHRFLRHQNEYWEAILTPHEVEIINQIKERVDKAMKAIGFA